MQEAKFLRDLTLGALSNIPCTIVSWKVRDISSCLLECGTVINKTLTSPGYPNNYPNNLDCVYYVHIPEGMALKVYFHHFDVDYDPSDQKNCP